MPNLVAAIVLMHDGKPAAALEHARLLPDTSLYHFVGRLTRAWLRLADKEKAGDAATELDGLESTQGMGALKTLHAALIADLAGDAEAATAHYDAALAQGRPPLRLVQLAAISSSATASATRRRRSIRSTPPRGTIAASPRPCRRPTPRRPRLVPNAEAGLAEALFDMASLVNQANAPDVALLNIRLALLLKPRLPAGAAGAGRHLRIDPALGRRPRRSMKASAPIRPMPGRRGCASPGAGGAAPGRSGGSHAARHGGERPASPEPLIELGDALRNRDQYQQAAQAYGGALTRVGTSPPARYWSLYYTPRQPPTERAGDWQAGRGGSAQVAVAAADQPDVLNYLGYAMVDRGENLPEAVTFIKRAVELRPNDGYIVDSLGWAYSARAI